MRKQLTEAEVGRRRAALASMRSHNRIENLTEHPADAELVDRYAAGELTIEEAIAAVGSRSGGGTNT